MPDKPPGCGQESATPAVGRNAMAGQGRVPGRGRAGGGARGGAVSRGRRDSCRALLRSADAAVCAAHSRFLECCGSPGPSPGVVAVGGDRELAEIVKVLDGLRAGKTQRGIARDIWGDARVAVEWSSDGWMRSQVRRWIPKATAMRQCRRHRSRVDEFRQTRRPRPPGIARGSAPLHPDYPNDWIGKLLTPQWVGAVQVAGVVTVLPAPDGTAANALRSRILLPAEPPISACVREPKAGVRPADRSRLGCVNDQLTLRRAELRRGQHDGPPQATRQTQT